MVKDLTKLKKWQQEAVILFQAEWDSYVQQERHNFMLKRCKGLEAEGHSDKDISEVVNCLFFKE